MLDYNYLLLDAARAEADLEKAKQLNADNKSLYLVKPEDELAAVAPYMFTAKIDTPFVNFFLDKGWNNNWGVLVECGLKFDEVFIHFRQFLMVKLEDGRQIYFRFYDPRVLRVFLPTCDKQQLKEFFGPVNSFITEDEDPEFVLKFWLEGLELKNERLPIQDALGDMTPAIEEETQASSIVQQQLVVESVTQNTPTATKVPRTENTPPIEEPGKKKRSFF